MSDKFLCFDGMHFTRDERSGYYLCSKQSEDGTRKRMHVYVWEYFNGPVPSGFHIHHMDGDKSNNNIENLEMLKCSDHLSLHGKEHAAAHHDEIAKRLNQLAVPKAKEWHGTEAGRKWHKMHYLQMRDKLHVERKFICQNCEKEYYSVQAASKFCSNNCKSAWRRKSGIDNITRECGYCGKGFAVNRYAKKKYCSKECAHEAAAKTRKAC